MPRCAAGWTCLPLPPLGVRTQLDVCHEQKALPLPAGSLLPGQLVTARVRNVLSDGLLASFLTYFT